MLLLNEMADEKALPKTAVARLIKDVLGDHVRCQAEVRDVVADACKGNRCLPTHISFSLAAVIGLFEHAMFSFLLLAGQSLL